MLIRLFGENFRSLRDPFELSMIAADLPTESGRGTHRIEMQDGESIDVLRTVAIFGANASGKSTIWYAAKALSWLVLHSSPKFESGKTIPPYEPFLLDEDFVTKSIKLGITFTLDQNIVEYRIEYTKDKIISEELIDYSLENPEVLCRDESGNASGLLAEYEVIQLYARGLPQSVSLVSKLAQHGPQDGDESIKPYFDAIRLALQIRDYTSAASGRNLFDDRVAKKIDQSSDFRHWLVHHFVKPADLGIIDVETKPLDLPDEVITMLNEEEAFGGLRSLLETEFVHQGKSAKGIKFTNESAGTRKMYDLAYDWWRMSQNEIALFADELTASLHPLLLDNLVRRNNDLSEGPARSQLIFTTHDPGLLESRDGEEPALRRDQVYFTQKNSEGASKLYSLAEFKGDARGVHNLRKRYLSGRYGGIPLVDSYSLARAFPNDE